MNPLKTKFPLRALNRIQSRAALSRAIERFRSPRRIVLSIIGVILAVIWIGQAAVGILFRESADPEKLAVWIPLSLTYYAIWNLMKVIFRKPIDPFEWTAAEEELLLGAPIPRQELVRFRFSRVLKAAVFKSAIFSLIMIPDLQVFPLGFAGMLIGLIVIDLMRMIGAVIAWGLSRRELIVMRVAAGGFATLIVTFVVGWVFQTVDLAGGVAELWSIKFLYGLLHGSIALSQTTIGSWVTAPFGLISSLMLADGLTLSVLAKLALTVILAWLMLRGLLVADRIFHARRAKNERANLELARSLTVVKQRNDQTIRPKVKPLRLGGLGPLGWRQLIGARNYRNQLFFALAVPLVLSCLPAMSGATGLMLVMNVTGGLAFYSFLLLPTTMPFDMRRDLDRIAVLKSLPISPLRIVLGQLSAPVVLTSLFQIATLLVTMAICPFDIVYFFIALGILLPFNVFIFGLENLLVLWYPYRMNQEGVKVFLRTILAFTAKGVLFGVAAAAILIWAYASKVLAQTLLPHSPQFGMSLFFTIGGFTGTLLTSAGIVALLSRAFERFDPTCDLAGLD